MTSDGATGFAAGPIRHSISHHDERTPLLQSGHQAQSSPSPPSPPPPPSSGPEPQGPEQEETTVLPTAPLSPARLWLTLSASYVGVFLGAVDSSIMATLSAPIASEFHSLSLLSWLATAYLIANATCQPLSGRLTDIFGRGPGLVFSNIMFALGNLVCGLATGGGTMIAGRVIAGVGGGGLMSISTFLASDLVPLKKRGVVQGVGNIAYGSGAMLGGVLGGFINDTSSWGWRLAFLLQVPIILVSGFLVWYLVDVPPKISNKSLLARIDYGGSFLTVGFLVLVLLGLNAGGNLVPWTDPLVLVTLPLGGIMLLALVWWESRAKQPIVPVRLLLHRTVLMACLTSFLCTMVMMMILYYVPLYLQVLGHSATQAGLRILASSFGVSVASIGCGFIMKKTGKYVGLGIGVLTVYTVAMSMVVTFDADAPNWVPFVAMALLGAAYGGMLTVTLLACIAAVDHSHQAVITSATYLFRSVGATLGITVASAIYQNILRDRLWNRFGDLPGAADEIERIRDDLGELTRLPEGWYQGVIASFMEAFRGVWVMALALTIAGLISISLMKQHKLHANLARQDE
ncbi:major facilitator superfamily domain-containing protein [Corynascus novoguineensis]|uniref:Major facilitator superfamily domain-containing protein n=1 Tax=Corynascus novoguineensis TaxID=1126955 RepID=A0AAN7D191_9PEZI|nr:major facilitator superfamily domain-containing protein [Corynascus novoguineensis]